jgi:uncharacterized protein
MSKAHHFCEGCFRSSEEITQWMTLSDDQKKQINELAAQRQIDLISF